jgi:thimet oligopeptidase
MVGKIVCFVLLLLASLALLFAVYVRRQPVPKNLIHFSQGLGINGLFPQNATEIDQRLGVYKKDVQQQIAALKKVPAHERTFANTAQALDSAMVRSDLSIFRGALSALKYLHPDADMRAAVGKQLSGLSAFFVDMLFDKELYSAFKEYTQGNAFQEQLTAEQRYYLDDLMKDFIHMGLELPDDKLEQVKALKKELSNLSLEFDKNIAEDNTTIEATKEELAGLSEDFIASLKQTQNGNYLLGLDYPTVTEVMESAENPEIRKRLSIAFNNRAYPANEPVLKQIIAKRDERAKLLGFASYAHLDLDDEMVKTPERAEAFLDHVIERAGVKAQLEYEMFKKELPTSVVLDESGKFYPWDLSYVLHAYKKKHFDIDEQKIAEYFPVNKTIEGLFAIYQQFFSLRFEEMPISGLWSDDLRLIKIHDAHTDASLGYVLLDLYPRDNKFSHAANLTVVPAITDQDGTDNLNLSIIMANFPKAQGDKPALFKRSDVRTFFHEFGHALHALLGRTTLAGLSGTHVKSDFVELPSQMLESWLYDKAILQLVSSHYKTGEPLPDEIIDRLLQLKNLNSGSFVQRQGLFAKLSLAYFAPGVNKNLDEVYRGLRKSIMRNVVYVPEDHMYAAFGHLTDYGAKYYGYLWSDVFAQDLFAEIKKHGLLNPEIGKKYVDLVIGRGGSADPNELLRDFLGREPNDAAFFEEMGL